MQRILHSLRARHEWIVLILLAAFGLRALVPSGFMLQADAEGNLGFELCSVAAPALADTADDAGHPPDSPAQWTHDGASQCAYSAVALQIPVGVPALVAPQLRSFGGDGLPDSVAPRPALFVGSHSSRGPPQFS